MEGKGTISDYRSKLDKTLASPDLTNDEVIHTLVKNQILQSSDCQLEDYSEYVVAKRSKEMSSFLSMLRSASENEVERSKSSNQSHIGWKVKQDTDEFRVMYRAGPEGTPFHTLLAEGYVEGPLDVCLCISCESDLYKKWWPQTAIPTFKVISSQCIQKVRTGEQISIVRMKLSWPLSSREALVHYFAFEYFQDDLIVVLLNSISDLEAVDRRTHGFTQDGIPEAEDVVRIDVVGGFAIQKVTSDRSYFRTIANLDIKLDFVPPSFINFISRQLVGSGFKLYKKEVASVSKGDEKFCEALKDPFYTHVHEALYSENKSMASPTPENLRSTSIILEEKRTEASEDSSAKEKNDHENCVSDSEAKDVDIRDGEVLNEIKEFKEKESEISESLDESTQKLSVNLTSEITEVVRIDEAEVVVSTEVEQAPRTTNEITEQLGSEIKNKVDISPEVQQALGILEKAITIFREFNSNPGKVQTDVQKEHLEDSSEEAISSEADQTRRKNGSRGESSETRPTELNSHEPRESSDNHGSRHKRSNSYTRETNQCKISPDSPDEGGSSPSHIKHIDLNSSVNQRTISTVSENITENHLLSAESADDAEVINGERVTKRKNRKSMFCCFSLTSGEVQ